MSRITQSADGHKYHKTMCYLDHTEDLAVNRRELRIDTCIASLNEGVDVR